MTAKKTTRLTYAKCFEIHDQAFSLLTAVRASLRAEHQTNRNADRSLQDAVEALRCALRSMEHGGIDLSDMVPQPEENK